MQDDAVSNKKQNSDSSVGGMAAGPLYVLSAQSQQKIELVSWRRKINDTDWDMWLHGPTEPKLKLFSWQMIPSSASWLMSVHPTLHARVAWRGSCRQDECLSTP
jgi:hypothetical protein